MEGKEKGEKRQGKEEKWGWVGGMSLWKSGATLLFVPTTLITFSNFCSLFLSPPLPSFQGWLCDVESMMHVTLKDILRACRIDLKKHLNKRDKWIRDWPGQVGKETDF